MVSIKCVSVCVQRLKDAGVEIPEAGGKTKSSTEEASKVLKEEVRRLKDELEASKQGMSQPDFLSALGVGVSA